MNRRIKSSIMLSRWTFTVFAAGLLSTPLLAEEINLPDELPVELQSKVLTNMSDDQALCSAFYQIVSECLNNTEPGKGNPYEQLSLIVLQRAATYLTLSNSTTLVNDGQEVNLEIVSETSLETLEIWYDRYRKEMLNKAMTCGNLSLLYSKHLEPCNNYYTDADSLLQKWVTELLQE
jgi:hypothetical protein